MYCVALRYNHVMLSALAEGTQHCILSLLTTNNSCFYFLFLMENRFGCLFILFSTNLAMTSPVTAELPTAPKVATARLDPGQES